jgi:hypothetical protein
VVKQTIQICKQTAPAGGTGFAFTRADGSGALPGFSLSDGGCAKFDLTNADHYNKFTEVVPSGWTLTNIVCVNATHSTVVINGANPIPAFEPGDNTVSIDLADTAATCTFTNTKSQNQTGMLKICKVAGTGVPVGMPFSFNASGTFSVPAGSPPGGNCVLGPNLPVNSNATVVENIPAGYAITSIVAEPSGQLISANTGTGAAVVAIGSGVTEVTYTNEKHTGWLEICKQGHVSGTFGFSVNPGNLGPFNVPAGACSPAIEVAAGPVVIHETLINGTSMVGCATIPVIRQVSCSTTTQDSTVTVVPGNVSTQTIAIITDK